LPLVCNCLSVAGSDQRTSKIWTLSSSCEPFDFRHIVPEVLTLPGVKYSAFFPQSAAFIDVMLKSSIPYDGRILTARRRVPGPLF
jgi:hypothetical protein